MGMFYFSSFPFLRLVPAFVTGIVAYIYLHPAYSSWLVIGLAALLYTVTDLLWLKLYRNFRLRFISGIASAVLMCSLGMAVAYTNDPLQQPGFFTGIKNTTAYNGYICDTPAEKENSWKTTITITHVRHRNHWYPVHGKVVAYIRKRENNRPLYGQTLLFTCRPSEIDEPRNPGQFNYKQYLSYHGIFHRVYLHSHNSRITGRKNFPLFNFAADLRNTLMHTLHTQGLRGNEYAVAGALVLGITDQLSPDVIRAYASTGALHVLSVSGLHVGVLYIMLNFLLRFMDGNRKSKLIKSTLVLLLIWFYALLTGLSPSVLRSATMFSFIAVGALLNRKGNVYNSIAASAFVLLCINPYLIMQVGFQLSYLAVLGIVYLYPKIYGWFYFYSWLGDKIWSVSAVSLSAQFITFPLGLMYYHQFPNYFFLSNLIVIPLGSLILYTGIAALTLNQIPGIGWLLAMVLYYEVKLLNLSVNWVEHLPYALYEGVSIGITETWLLYFVCALLVIAWQYRRPTFLLPAVLCLTAFSLFQFTSVEKCSRQQKIIFYQTPGHIAIDVIHGREHVFISDTTFYRNQSAMLFHVKHNWDNLHLHKEKFVESFSCTRFKNIRLNGPVLLVNDKRILLVNDTTCAWKYTHYGPFDAMVLYGQPRLYIKRLFAQVKFKKLVLAGNNGYKKKYWLNDARELKIPFYDMEQQGALIMDLKNKTSQ